jgi:hypothetical protein
VLRLAARSAMMHDEHFRGLARLLSADVAFNQDEREVETPRTAGR